MPDPGDPGDRRVHPLGKRKRKHLRDPARHHHDRREREPHVVEIQEGAEGFVMLQAVPAPGKERDDQKEEHPQDKQVGVHLAQGRRARKGRSTW